MVLIEVQEDRHMRRGIEVGELMTGKLIDDRRALMDRVIVVKARKTYVSAEDRVAIPDLGKNVIQKR